MFKKDNPCPDCGSHEFIRRMATKYSYREYCNACGKWKRKFTERTDGGKGAPSHCGKCRYFRSTVFEGETQNGHASWYGYCTNGKEARHETISRYYGCDFGEYGEFEEI